MTDSAVLDTILGLIFLFYALALLCGGLVEMIAISIIHLVYVGDSSYIIDN